MNSEAPIGEARRGTSHRRRTFLILFVASALGLLLGWFILAGGITGRWIASKIQARTGMEARVGGVSWSPWNGVSINAVELLQSAPLRTAVQNPLVRIDSIRLAPVWRAWLRGRLEVRSITLDTVSVVLPVELIYELARQTAPAQPAPPPAVAAVQAPAVAAQPAPTAPPATAPGPPPTASIPKPPAPPPAPTGWLHLKNAAVTVVHAGSRRSLLEVSKTSGSIPITGDSAQSVLKFGRIAALGNELAANLAAEIEWTAPVLSLKPLNLETSGYKYVIAGKIVQGRGLPLLIEAQLPRQKLASVVLPFDGQASAEAIAGNARLRGLLLAPGTWQGDLLAEALYPSLRVATHEAKFDKGSAITVLRGGVLSCVDARLIGDDLSLLGNATLIADGRAAGAARLVAAPETLAAITHRALPVLQGSPSLTELATPQRVAFDVEAFGNISQLFLRLGRDGPIVNLNHKSSP